VQEDITTSEEQIPDPRAAHEACMKAMRDALAAKCLELFPDPVSITLEVGCGHGHFLTSYAQAHPDEICVGVDLVTKRVVKGQSKRDKRALNKLHFIKAEVLEFLDVLPAHVSISRCFVLFPDPWPKKRHAKKRIVQAPLLDKVAAKTSPGGMLCLRTDHEEYFQWIVEHVAASPNWDIDDEAEWPFESSSFFQELMDGWQSLIAIRSGE